MCVNGGGWVGCCLLLGSWGVRVLEREDQRTEDAMDNLTFFSFKSMFCPFRQTPTWEVHKIHLGTKLREWEPQECKTSGRSHTDSALAQACAAPAAMAVKTSSCSTSSSSRACTSTTCDSHCEVAGHVVLGQISAIVSTGSNSSPTGSQM